MNKLILLTALALSSCGGGGSDKPRPHPVPPTGPVVSTWQIGPVIDGKNFSTGLPLNPAVYPEGFVIDFGPGRSPHYVTKATGSLAGKSLIRMRFRTEGAPIIGEKCGATGSLSLYFEDTSNDWHGDGGRWWASGHTVVLDQPGTFEVVAPLAGEGWSSVLTWFAKDHPREFAIAKSKAKRVGFTLGNCEGLGHGITSTGQARIVVTHYGVE